MLRISYIIKYHENLKLLLIIFDTFEKNLIFDEVDAYVERIRIPLLNRIYLKCAHPRRLLMYLYRAISPFKVDLRFFAIMFIVYQKRYFTTHPINRLVALTMLLRFMFHAYLLLQSLLYKEIM